MSVSKFYLPKQNFKTKRRLFLCPIITHLANYSEIIKPHLKEKDNLIIVDNSEIIKPYSKKLEGLGQVRDGSTGKIEKGYWTTNMIAVAKDTKHPIPVYSHLYSSSEEGFISENEETYKGLYHVRNILAEKRATFIMDRGYDNVRTMKKKPTPNISK